MPLTVDVKGSSHAARIELFVIADGATNLADPHFRDDLDGLPLNGQLLFVLSDPSRDPFITCLTVVHGLGSLT